MRHLTLEPLELRTLLDADPYGLFPGEQYLVGGSPNSVAVGDFDGDGHANLVAANTGGKGVSAEAVPIRFNATSLVLTACVRCQHLRRLHMARKRIVFVQRRGVDRVAFGRHNHFHTY
ncbi:FG-GAP repeat protein [Isosphaeraceae bacterium EP7]